MTAIGTIIEAGDQIPADVTGMFDREGDPWFLLPNGHWHTSALAIRECSANECEPGDFASDPLEYAPLTVAAVRS